MYGLEEALRRFETGEYIGMYPEKDISIERRELQNIIGSNPSRQIVFTVVKQEWQIVICIAFALITTLI
jgi:hypothetical protein